MLLTVEGKYKDGKVALLEAPPGMGEARVFVTFLPERAPEITPRMMQLGQFAGPNTSTEDDFKHAEWHGEMGICVTLRAFFRMVKRHWRRSLPSAAGALTGGFGRP